MTLKNWYEAKLLFMEKKKNEIFGLRFYILFKENKFRDAEKKAKQIGKSMAYPYRLSPRIEFKFLGLEALWQCYSEPKDGAMLSVFKDSGDKWEDALIHIKPLSQYEISTFRCSPIGLYLANVVYFVKANKHAKNGKVTTCQILFKSKNKRDVLNKIYPIAVHSKTFRDVVKIRRDCRKKFISEFAGIEEIIPIFHPIKDCMEINRTVERFKNMNELFKVLETVGAENSTEKLIGS